MRHREIYGLCKAPQLALNLSTPFRTGGGLGWKEDGKLRRPLGIVNLFPWRGSRVKRVTSCLLDDCLRDDLLPFPIPCSLLPYPIPAHQYQLAVPHIRGRMGPNQLLFLCTKLYPGEQYSQRGLTCEWEVMQKLRENWLRDPL